MEECETQLKDIAARLDEIEAQIIDIKKRNRRVEGDKAWETSSFRVWSITTITYIVAVIVMWGIGVSNIFLNALIPTVGFFLSTQSLPFIKRWWLRRH